MPRRDSLGRVLSDDGLWYWAGDRWRPATGAIPPGLPPRAPGSPWPWLVLGCGALLLITFVPPAVLWLKLGNDPGLSDSFRRGFARTYVQQRQAALASIDTAARNLAACEASSTAPCLSQADDVAGAARAEDRTVRLQPGLVFFPGCLRTPAEDESAALETVASAAATIRDLQPADEADVRPRLDAISGGLQRAQAALQAAAACT